MRMISGSQRGPRGCRFHLARHMRRQNDILASASQSTRSTGRSFHFISSSRLMAMFCALATDPATVAPPRRSPGPSDGAA